MEISETIVDAHVHCGIQDTYTCQSLEDYMKAIKGSGIQAAVMFPPVIEIYDRHNPYFEDSAYWRDRRRKANRYVEMLQDSTIRIIPYFFIWNDFAVDQISDRHKGIKWHRHMDEPVYRYHTEKCRKAVDTIRDLRMPIIYEEELDNTLEFINRIATDIRIIIPHLGLLNGSYHALKRHGIWKNPMVYTDTALAGTAEIRDYIREFGTQRILFGSDFPFGNPKRELSKIFDLALDSEQETAILAGNLKQILSDSNRQRSVQSY